MSGETQNQNMELKMKYKFAPEDVEPLFDHCSKEERISLVMPDEGKGGCHD